MKRSATREENAIVTLADRPTSKGAARRHDGGGAESGSIRSLPRAAECWIIAALLLWLLTGPRIELPWALGLRVEDLVFVVLAVSCVAHYKLPKRPAPATIAITAVVLAGLTSAAVASARGMVAPLTSALFAVRPAEYWIVFPTALLLLRAGDGRWTKRIDRLLVAVTLLQTAFAVLQYYFGLPWGFSHAAYTRAAGLTVGPYELGAIAAMLVVYWISRGRWAMASLAAIALAASISRISILGAAAAITVFVTVWSARLIVQIRTDGRDIALRPLRRSIPLIVGQSASVVSAGLVLAFTVGLIHLPAIQLPTAPSAQSPAEPELPATDDEPGASPSPTPPADAGTIGPQAPSNSITQRLESTSVVGSWNAAESLARRVPHPPTSEDYQYAAYAGLNIYVNANTATESGAEASNLIRFFRWHLILDTIDDPADWIFGLGPSFVGPSVDGSYLRMLADGGLLGVLAWIALIVAWLRRQPLWMLCVTISLLVGAAFIDILYAQRPMVLFWALLAVAVARTRERQDVDSAAVGPQSGKADRTLAGT